MYFLNRLTVHCPVVNQTQPTMTVEVVEVEVVELRENKFYQQAFHTRDLVVILVEDR